MVSTGGRERLHLDLRAALHDDRVRTRRARGTRCWRKHEFRIWDRCFAGHWLCELREHRDVIRVHPADSRVPREERLPDEAVRTPEWRSHGASVLRSHAVVRRHEDAARRARGANNDDAVAVESGVPAETLASTAPVVPCEARRWRNEKKRNCQEGDRDYLSHFYYLTSYKLSPQAMRRQRFDLSANVCVGDNKLHRESADVEG